MKRIKCLLVLISTFLSIFPAKSQQTDSAIEIRLDLLKPSVGNEAVTVSIINKSDEDIYVPDFALFASLSGIHCYEKQAGGYREYNLTFHMYEDDYENNKFEETSIRISKNGTLKKLSPHVQAILNKQKSIAWAYCWQNNITAQTNPGLYNSLLSGRNNAVFLKAKDSLDVFSVIPIDFLFQKEADYKFAFNSEPRDTIMYNFQTGTSIGASSIAFPENIMGFKRFKGKNVKSNLLFFSSKK